MKPDEGRRAKKYHMLFEKMEAGIYGRNSQRFINVCTINF